MYRRCLFRLQIRTTSERKWLFTCTALEKKKNLFVFILKKHWTDHLEEKHPVLPPVVFPYQSLWLRHGHFWFWLAFASTPVDFCHRPAPEACCSSLLSLPLCVCACVYWSINACNTFIYTPPLPRMPLFSFASVRPLKCSVSSDPSVLLNSWASQSHRRLNGSLRWRCCCFYSVLFLHQDSFQPERWGHEDCWQYASTRGICVVFIVTAVYQMQQHVLTSGRICHAVMEGTKDASLKITRCKNDPNCMIHTLTLCERERELQLL